MAAEARQRQRRKCKEEEGKTWSKYYEEEKVQRKKEADEAVRWDRDARSEARRRAEEEYSEETYDDEVASSRSRSPRARTSREKTTYDELLLIAATAAEVLPELIERSINQQKTSKEYKSKPACIHVLYENVVRCVNLYYMTFQETE